MQAQYTVQIDSKGHVLIPAEVRRDMGLEPKSLLILKIEHGEIRLAPGEVIPRRRIRQISREELAQGLMDSGVTEEGRQAAAEAVRELGLTPEDFKPKF